MNFDSLAETITARLIERIEAADLDNSIGALWTGAGASHFAPLNATTSSFYNGFNILALYIAGTDNGYLSAEWATYRQWASVDAQVRKGESGTHIVKWVPITSQDDTEDTEAAQPRLVPKVYSVFNAAQVDGYQNGVPEPIDRISNVEQFISATGAVINRGSGRAFYSLADDAITLPDVDQFIDTESNYAVTLHELTHWTGAAHRLNRQLGHPKDSSEYAFEELVAELGAAMLCARLNITNEPRDDHAIYLKHWLQALRSDSKHIVAAASKARAALGFLETLQPEPEMSGAEQ